MNRVRVNQIQRTTRDGLPVFLKRRRFGGSIVIWFGNRFLSLASSGICMFVRARYPSSSRNRNVLTTSATIPNDSITQFIDCVD